MKVPIKQWDELICKNQYFIEKSLGLENTNIFVIISRDELTTRFFFLFWLQVITLCRRQ